MEKKATLQTMVPKGSGREEESVLSRAWPSVDSPASCTFPILGSLMHFDSNMPEYLAYLLAPHARGPHMSCAKPSAEAEHGADSGVGSREESPHRFDW